MRDKRLIEVWLPIADLGEESVRERRSMTALPPVYYLHVWWARRPLVASRAAILASLLPSNADRDKYKHVLGIHGDPVASRRRIDLAKRTGNRFEGEAYDYPRAFSYLPSVADGEWLAAEVAKVGVDSPVVLDPTAGGGSIPLETVRLGLESIANDLNPVAALILRATVEFPSRLGMAALREYVRISKEFIARREDRLGEFYPNEDDPDSISTNYLWARTVRCPYCEGIVPLSPNWRLKGSGVGVKVIPNLVTRHCSFQVVNSAAAQSPGTVTRGNAQCPYPDCGRVIDGTEIKKQAQEEGLGDQLYAVVYKKRIKTTTKTGRISEKWVKKYRAPLPLDDNLSNIASMIDKKMPEWLSLGIVPTESIPDGSKTAEPIRYGAVKWTDLFSARQFLAHATSVEVFRELLSNDITAHGLNDSAKAAFVYLSFVIDKYLNYNSRMSIWMSTREVVANTFNRHDFAFCWSYAEMSPLVRGMGSDWAVDQTGKCIKQLIQLVRPEEKGRKGSSRKKQMEMLQEPCSKPGEVVIYCRPGDSLSAIDDSSVDAVVMDPPYYDNVMYAELADYFYVWLKRTAGHIYPDLFTRQLTDKENEAVANPAKFEEKRKGRLLANRDYQDRMAAIFAETRRVLKPNGIMTLMFTHRATGAWDALTKGLMEAGFTITASWPINTEPESSLNIKDKAAANSTILLVCRPRVTEAGVVESGAYWEDVEPQVARAVRAKVAEFQKAGITGVDLYLASFGPALEEFSKHWPLKRGVPRDLPKERRRRKQADLFEEEFDPYAVTPEDALDAARREVKRWRIEQLTHLKARDELDPTTSFFVLAWDAFRAPTFGYDEALRLAHAVGVDIDRDIVGKLGEKKAGNIRLWDSERRAAKGALGSPDGSRGMIDAIHHAAHLGRSRTLAAARDLVERAGLHDRPEFRAAFEAVLEVLPPSRAFTGIELEGDAASAGNDFEALENLRRLAFSGKVDKPKQLALWEEGGGAG